MERCTPQPKVLLRDEDDRVIAVECTKCGKLALNVSTGLCCGCGFSPELLALMDAPETNAADRSPGEPS